MAKNVTKKQAHAAAAKLAEHFKVDADVFTVYEPGFHADGWTIAAEGGAPYYWTPQASEVLNGDHSGPVFHEPINHWLLGLYPA